MKHFRHLANRGATVLVLCHTGKSSNSQEYRGSSDIEAAVDMAFLLESPGKDRKVLDYLTLTPFKCRIVPVESRCLKYSEGKGFELSALQAQVQRPAKANAQAVVEQIVRECAGLSQSAIVRAAKEQEVSKGMVTGVLKGARFRRIKGKGNTHLYYLAEEPIPAQPDGDQDQEAA